MTDDTKLLKEISERAYYTKSSESVELGRYRFIDDKEWGIKTVLLLLFIAILLWVLSYALLMTILFFYDEGMQVTFDFEFLYFNNESNIYEDNIEKYAHFY